MHSVANYISYGHIFQKIGQNFLISRLFSSKTLNLINTNSHMAKYFAHSLKKNPKTQFRAILKLPYIYCEFLKITVFKPHNLIIYFFNDLVPFNFQCPIRLIILKFFFH